MLFTKSTSYNNVGFVIKPIIFQLSFICMLQGPTGGKNSKAKYFLYKQLFVCQDSLRYKYMYC